MANFLYNSYKIHALSGTMDLSDGNVHALLVDNTYPISTTTSKETHTVTGDVGSYEVVNLAGSAYSPGGKVVPSATVAGDGGSLHLGVFNGAAVSWTSSTLTASGAIVWYSGGTPATSHLIGYVDFGDDQSSTNGTFQINWNSQGIINLGDS